MGGWWNEIWKGLLVDGPVHPFGSVVWRTQVFFQISWAAKLEKSFFVFQLVVAVALMYCMDYEI